MLISLRQRDLGWVLLCGVAAVLQICELVAARSAGSLLAVIIALATMTALTSFSGLGRVVRGAFTATIAVVVMVASLNYRTISGALIQLASENFHKDPTLTGRTYLWYRAEDIIKYKHLGVGYSAFWIQGNIDAEGLWRYAGIRDRGGFNFHNTFVDLLVMLGWPGVIAMALTLLIGSTLLVRHFVERPTMPLIFWITILLYVASRMPVETLGIQQLYHSTLLLFAALSAGLANPRLSAANPRLSAIALDYNLPNIHNIDYTRTSAVRAGRIPYAARFSYGARLRVRAETLKSLHKDLSTASSSD
jgi:exopolysaccharide production protein ExoQ